MEHAHLGHDESNVASSKCSFRHFSASISIGRLFATRLQCYLVCVGDGDSFGVIELHGYVSHARMSGEPGNVVAFTRVAGV